MNYSIKNTALSKGDILKMGKNVLTGKKPVMRDAKGRAFSPLWGKDIDFVTAETIYQHIDFLAELPFTVTYDMEETVEFEAALVSSYYTTNANYCLEDFKIYCSDSETDLYSDENIIGEYSNAGVYNKQNRDGSIVRFEFDTPHKARYFGLRVFATNPTDAIARIAKICVFSKAYEKQRTYINRYGNAVSRGVEVEFIDHTGKSGCIWPNYGLLSYLDDGVALDSQKAASLTFRTPVDAVYRFENITDVNKVVIAHDGNLPEIEIFVSDDIKTLYENAVNYDYTEESVDSGTVSVFSFPERGASCVAVRFVYAGEAKTAELTEIAVCSSAVAIDASGGEVICEDFIGNGENLVPFALQPGNIKAGYNDELYEVDRRRTLKIKPSLIRLWMQVDWFEKQKGVYDFDTPEMEAVWRYLELFRESGSEVQLTHSWKVGPEAQEWFSIPGVKEPRNSAPVDPEHYAEGYSKLMQEIWRRGFFNVFHVSFANEPGFSWDFQCHGNRKDYYAKVVRAVDKRFREDGIREKTVFWCCECAESMEWIEYCRENLDDCVDYYTFHCYECPEDKLEERIFKKVRQIGAQPFLFTECSENGANMKNPWNRSLAGLLIETANLGGAGIVMWTLHGIKSMSIWEPNSWTMNEPGHLWNTQLLGGQPNLNFYNMGMFTRYLPAHSKVLKTDVIGDGMRAATFLTQDGELTLIVECKEDVSDRAVKVKLPAGTKKLYKHIYCPARIACTYDAILPETAKVIECDGTFTDNEIPNDYSVLVYTTMPSQAQIALSDDRISLAAGESVALSARVIDGEGKVLYSTLGNKGHITADGVFTAKDLSAGDTVAVLAELESDPAVQGIAIIHII